MTQTNPTMDGMRSRRRILARWTGWGAVLAVIAAGASLSLTTGGRSDVAITDLSGIFAGNDATLAQEIMRDIRLPRTLVAAMLGLNLGLAGLLLQAVTRNALASPGILGINQGAALGLVAWVTLPQFAVFPPAALASAGGLGAAIVTFAIAGAFSGRIDGLRLVLGGVAVGAFGYAAVRLGYTLDDDLARAVLRWTIGEIADIRMDAVQRLVVPALAGLISTAALAQRLNLMALGQATSHGLGADPRVTLSIGTLIAAVLTGVSVSVAGPIAFAGLVVPHLAKTLAGADHRLLVPVTAVLGAGLMLWADALSKLMPGPAEIPIGIVVALIGAPWFLFRTVWQGDRA